MSHVPFKRLPFANHVALHTVFLLAKPEAVIEVAKARNIELPHDLEIIDPDLIRDNYVPKMVELRKGKFNDLQAREQLQDTVVLRHHDA